MDPMDLRWKGKGAWWLLRECKPCIDSCMCRMGARVCAADPACTTIRYAQHRCPCWLAGISFLSAGWKHPRWDPWIQVSPSFVLIDQITRDGLVPFGSLAFLFLSLPARVRWLQDLHLLRTLECRARIRCRCETFDDWMVQQHRPLPTWPFPSARNQETRPVRSLAALQTASMPDATKLSSFFLPQHVAIASDPSVGRVANVLGWDARLLLRGFQKRGSVPPTSLRRVLWSSSTCRCLLRRQKKRRGHVIRALVRLDIANGPAGRGDLFASGCQPI